MEYITLIAGMLEEILPLASSVTSGGAQNIINILEKVIPVAVQAGESLLTPIQNIIAALQGNGSVTADQVTTLQTQSATVDAALDAAAQADGLTTATAATTAPAIGGADATGDELTVGANLAAS